MDSTYRITLDTQAAGSQVTLQCKKGDVGRKIEISLVQAGSPFQIPDGAYAVLMAHKPDDHILYNYAQIDGGKIVYKMTAQTTAAAGTAQCEIRLYSSAGEVLTTARFDLLIDEAVYSDAQVQSADEFTALTDLVSQVMALLERIGVTVRAVNGKTPNDNGAVYIIADDIDTQQGSWHFQGNLADALDDLHDVLTDLIVRSVAGMLTSVNGKAGTDGAVTLDSDEIQMADGLSGWEGYTVTEAVDKVMNSIPSSVVINAMILKLLKDYVKTVNGTAPGEDGNVLLESDNIGMSDGEYGFGGYNVTQALELVNSSIPDKTVIDGYIDQKIKEIPPCVKDVKINSVSVVMREEANIALSGSLQFVSRILGITPTTEENITQRVQTRALTLNKLDSAVKAAMCDGTGAAWTESEQAAARERIGIKSTEGVLF